jgi:CheY-like chemotaxis protein
VNPSAKNPSPEKAINLRLLEVFAKKAGHVYRTAKNGQEAVRIYENSVEQQQHHPPTTNATTDDSASPHELTTTSTLHPTTTSASQSHSHKPKPEVILLDLNMPLMDGFEAARAIRSFEKSSGCERATIVAVTGLGDVAAQERAFASGMDLFLTKPVKMREVREVLEGVRGRGSGAV